MADMSNWAAQSRNGKRPASAQILSMADEQHRYPKLREHLGSVVTRIRSRAKLDRLHPRYGKPTHLSFEHAHEEKEDTGEGL